MWPVNSLSEPASYLAASIPRARGRTHASHDGIFSTITGRVLVMLAIATHYLLGLLLVLAIRRASIAAVSRPRALTGLAGYGQPVRRHAIRSSFAD